LSVIFILTIVVIFSALFCQMICHSIDDVVALRVHFTFVFILVHSCLCLIRFIVFIRTFVSWSGNFASHLSLVRSVVGLFHSLFLCISSSIIFFHLHLCDNICCTLPGHYIQCCDVVFICRYFRHDYFDTV